MCGYEEGIPISMKNTQRYLGEEDHDSTYSWVVQENVCVCICVHTLMYVCIMRERSNKKANGTKY